MWCNRHYGSTRIDRGRHREGRPNDPQPRVLATIERALRVSLGKGMPSPAPTVLAFDSVASSHCHLDRFVVLFSSHFLFPSQKTNLLWMRARAQHRNPRHAYVVAVLRCCDASHAHTHACAHTHAHPRIRVGHGNTATPQQPAPAGHSAVAVNRNTATRARLIHSPDRLARPHLGSGAPTLRRTCATTRRRCAQRRWPTPLPSPACRPSCPGSARR